MVASNEKPLQKQCRIKTAGLVRYQKEYLSYKKELQMDKEKIQKYQDENKDEYTIKKMKEVMEETKVMLPFVKKKLIEAIEELEMLVEENEESDQLKETEYLEKAQEQLKVSNGFIQAINEEEKLEEEQVEVDEV